MRRHVRQTFAWLTCTGVRVQDVANGEELHVLSGERRERGQRLPVLSAGETRGEEVQEGETLPRWSARPPTDAARLAGPKQARVDAIARRLLALSHRSHADEIRSKAMRSTPRVSRGHIIFVRGQSALVARRVYAERGG